MGIGMDVEEGGDTGCLEGKVGPMPTHGQEWK